MAAFVDSAGGGDPGMMENFFQQIIADLKAGFPIWEDFSSKASKLHAVLRSAVSAIGAFLESMQKVADMALGTRGATGDLGSGLTRLCLRQRALEDKLKAFVNSILECLVNPLQERMDEWKKMMVVLDKDHAKESKRVHQEMKKSFAETVSLRKKAKKGKPRAGAQLEQAVAEYKEKYEMLEALERSAVRTALIEERSRFCHFINYLNPVMDCQLAMLSEISHVSEIISYLRIQSVQPCFGQNQCYLVQDWRKVNMPDGVLLSSPGSPSVSHGSSKSSQSSSSAEGCCQLPMCSPPSAIPQQQSCSSNGKQQSVDGHSAGTGSEEQNNDRSLTRQPLASTWLEQPSSQTFPGAVKANNKVIQQSGHCAKCCNHCQLPQSPTDKVNTYAVPLKAELPAQAVEGETSVEKNAADANNENINGEAPVGGYVNMNQLANLAVQQNDSSPRISVSCGRSDRNGDKNNKDRSERNGRGDKNSDRSDSNEVKKPDENGNVEQISKRNLRSHEHEREGSHGRSRTTEDIAVSRASCSRQEGGDKGNLSLKHRDLSLPPTFRKPFRTGGAANFIDSPKPFSLLSRGRSDRQGPLWQEIRQTRRANSRLPSESPPPPPLPDDYPTNTELVLESDYLPLPPPPLVPQDDGVSCWSKQLQYSTIPEGSMLSIAASGVEDDDMPFCQVKFDMKSKSLPRCGAEAVCGAEEKAKNTFADTIHQGVKLRRTLTNDRSAPRLPANP